MKLFLYLLLLVPQVLLGQQDLFDIQHFSIKDGLPDHQTLHIEQDKDGYIWGNSIGTLFRYDGYQFKIYRKQELGVSGIEFVNFVIDDNGLVWYFDFAQLPLNIKMLDSKENKTISIDDFFKNKLPFPSKEITRVYRDKELGIVLLTKNNGFYTYQNGQLKLLYQHDSPIEYSRVIGSSNGDIVFSHQDTLFQILPKGKKNITIGKGFILDILPINGSLYLWYGSFFDNREDLKFSEMVNYIKNEKPRYERISGKSIDWLEDKTPNLRYHSIVVDAERYLWTIQKKSIKAKLVGQSKNNQIVFNEEMSLNMESTTGNQRSSVDLRELYVDRQNNIWATSENGIYKISRRSIPFKSYLSGKSTRGIFRTGNQLLVNHVKASIIDLTKEEELDLDLPLKRLTFFDDNNKLWIGSEYGLTYWNTDWNTVDWTKTDWKKSDFYFKELKGFQYMIPFKSKHSNRLWMGTSQGLVYLDAKTDAIVAFETSNERLNTATIRYLYENKAGIWLVTNKGLFLMNGQGEILNEWSVQSGFPTNDFYHLHEDKGGVFWLGSSDIGLLSWDPLTDKKKVFGRGQGFLNENIYAVYEDNNGLLWLPTDYGLVRFNKETYEINTYLEEHGLPNNEFNSFSHYQDSLGNLYFGGLNGVITFNPKDFTKNTSTDIPLHLTAYKVLSNGQKDPLDLTGEARLTKQIVFRPNNKFFEVHFALMDFKNNNQRLYAYQIKGYDDTWRYTTENFIRIHSLPYGNYQLIIKGQVDGVAWSSNELILDISVPRPFYLQWWFVLLAITMAIISIVFYFKYKTNQLLEEQTRLEKMVKDRTAKIQEDKQIITAQAEALQEMDNFKTKFFSNITHEFRTPLTLILGPAQQLLENEEQPKKQKRLSGILKNARHLLSLINQLLDLSKLENSKMKMSWKYGNIIGYTEELFHTFDMLAEQKHHELIFTSNETKWKTYFDQDKWHKIVFNLLSNAIKYTNPNGKIELEINKTIYNEQETVYLKIKDNGMGMRSEHVAQVFNRFYQVDDSTTRFQEGAGIGLSLVKELVELQDGTIEVQSTIGKGTTFEIKIPVPQDIIEAPKLNESKFSDLPIELITVTDTETTAIAGKEQLEVLIIEDNADMRTYISECLDPKVYRISMASNGEEGIQKAIETIPDIIISDVMMPKKDGFEVVTELRQHLPTSHIPIVLLTAKAALDSRLEGLKRGADAYLTKPFSAKELIIRVHKLIELRQSIQQRYQSVATLHSDIISSEQTENNDKKQVEDQFVMDVRLYIEERLQNSSLSVEQIGEYFHMSRTQLYRKFKALTDTSISNFIKTLRMKKALTLLKDQKKTMSEVAYACGFSSPSHFSRMFKSVYGKSPSEMM